MKFHLTPAMAKRFSTLVTAASWINVVMRLTAFLFFPESAFWARVTLAARAVLLGIASLVGSV